MGQGHTMFTRYATGRGANPASILAPVTETATGALAWAGTRVRVTRIGPADGSLILFAGGMREHPEEHRGGEGDREGLEVGEGDRRISRSGAVGFARVVSDGSSMAWLGDVFVLEGHRGLGLGVEREFDWERLIVHPEKPLAAGVFAGWACRRWAPKVASSSSGRTRRRRSTRSSHW